MAPELIKFILIILYQLLECNNIYPMKHSSNFLLNKLLQLIQLLAEKKREFQRKYVCGQLTIFEFRRNVNTSCYAVWKHAVKDLNKNNNIIFLCFRIWLISFPVIRKRESGEMFRLFPTITIVSLNSFKIFSYFSRRFTR